MDERAGMPKQFKWNKFPFYGDRLSGKNFLLNNAAKKLLVKNV